MRLTLFILLSLVIGFTNSAFHKLGDVFQVDTRDPNDHQSSCLHKLDPNDPNSRTIFDPRAEFRDGTHLLNTIWYWINSMVVVTKQGIATEKYESNWNVRKLLYSFFGVKRAPNHPDQGPWEPPESSLPGQKLRKVRDVYENVLDVIERRQLNGPRKPKLFCDWTFAVWQRENDPALNRHGKPIKKPDSNEFYTLREWEHDHGRNFDDWWYFWMDFDDAKGYLVEGKTDPRAQYPYPLDPRTHNPSFCAQDGVFGQTWVTDVPTGLQGVGTDAWIRRSIVTLCPASFRRAVPHDPNLDEMPEGTHLDSMEISAVTFLHELFHLAHPRTFPDHKRCYAKYVDVQHGIPDPNFPAQKDAYDDDRHASGVDGNTMGALQSMTLALYELAHPETTDLLQLESIVDPELYAWFGLTMLLLSRTGQDWSTGAARPGHSEWGPVTAQIPNMWPPPAKIGPMTRPLSNASHDDPWQFDWEEIEKNITSLWRNTTAAMGPITSFDDFSTFVTSIKAQL